MIVTEINKFKMNIPVQNFPASNSSSPRLRRIIESRYLGGRFRDYDEYARDQVQIGELGSIKKKKTAFARYLKRTESKDVLPISRKTNQAGSLPISRKTSQVSTEFKSPN